MPIQPVDIVDVWITLETLLPSTEFCPHSVAESAKKNGWNLQIHCINNTTQKRTDESLAAEFMAIISNHVSGRCLLAHEEAVYEHIDTPYAMDLSDFLDFIRNSKHFIFDSDFVLICPDTPAVIGLHSDWPDSHVIIARPS
jgi:hypothetical protein